MARPREGATEAPIDVPSAPDIAASRLRHPGAPAVKQATTACGASAPRSPIGHSPRTNPEALVPLVPKKSWSDAAKESNLPSRGPPGPASFEDWRAYRVSPVFAEEWPAGNAGGNERVIQGMRLRGRHDGPRAPCRRPLRPLSRVNCHGRLGQESLPCPRRGAEPRQPHFRACSSPLAVWLACARRIGLAPDHLRCGRRHAARRGAG